MHTTDNALSDLLSFLCHEHILQQYEFSRVWCASRFMNFDNVTPMNRWLICTGDDIQYTNEIKYVIWSAKYKSRTDVGLVSIYLFLNVHAKVLHIIESSHPLYNFIGFLEFAHTRANTHRQWVKHWVSHSFERKTLCNVFGQHNMCWKKLDDLFGKFWINAIMEYCFRLNVEYVLKNNTV